MPFRILLLGDFSGRSDRENAPGILHFAERRPLRIDRDNVDDLLGALTVMLHTSLSVRTRPARSSIHSDGGFHPDSFHSRIELIRQLCELRRRLNNPATFHSAVSELTIWMMPQPSYEHPSIAPPLPSHHPENDAPPPNNLLDTLLDEAQRSPKVTSELQTSEWQTFVRSIVGPYLVPKEDPRASELIGQIDDMLGAILRRVLHHPDWQSLEATWRGLKFLVDRLETDGQLHLYLLDVTKDELSADLCTGNDLVATGLYQHLVNETVRTTGAFPWTVIGGAYTFDRSETDIALLHQIARIAQAAGAPFLAAGSPTIVGCPSFSTTPDPDDWERLSGK
jgi:type VI secretion system protein ImpC